jgi:hypothetical protein
LAVLWRSRGWDGEPGRAIGSLGLREKATFELLWLATVREAVQAAD